jgi:hypothetical protein
MQKSGRARLTARFCNMRAVDNESALATAHDKRQTVIADIVDDPRAELAGVPLAGLLDFCRGQLGRFRCRAFLCQADIKQQADSIRLKQQRDGSEARKPA